MVHDFPKALSVLDFCHLCTKKIQESFSKRAGGNPGKFGLLSQQQLVVRCPRTVWKIRYADHEVTGKTYNPKNEGLGWEV